VNHGIRSMRMRLQPYYTRLLAQACGLSVTLAPDGEKWSLPRPEVRQRATWLIKCEKRRQNSFLPPYLFVDPVLSI